MEDKKRDEDTLVPTDTTKNETISESVSETATVSEDTKDVPSTEKVESEVNENTAENTEVDTHKSSNKRITYIISAVVVIVIGLGLIFVLESEHRINTGLFTNIIADMEAKEPVAKVNGVVIPNSDLETGVSQLMEMAKLQGVDTSDENTIQEFRSQAVETLINGEVLRQAAIEKGMTATVEAIDARYSEISTGVGGEEALKAKMAEYGITEANLRRDIENEILIQALFDTVMKKEDIEVTEEEISGLYEQAGGADAELPPLEQVRDQIVEQIRNDKQQQQIGAYIDELREKANIEILI